MKSPKAVRVSWGRLISVGLYLCKYLILFIVLSWPFSTLAHGSGTPRLVNVAVGPYRLSAWSSPEPPRVGDLHIAITVDEPRANNATADSSQASLDVQVEMTSLNYPGAQIIQRATKQATLLQYYYESYFTVPSTGQWQVAVTVTGVAGSGTAGFALEVLPHQRVNWQLVFWSVIALLIIIWATRVTRTAS